MTDGTINGMPATDTTSTTGEAPSSDVSIKFTAVSVTHAYGCNGWSPYDEIDGTSIFVKPGHLNEGELDALEETLDNLWPPKHGGAPHPSKVAAVTELSVDLPTIEVSPVPVWNQDFTGTLRDWVTAMHDHATQQVEVNRAWEQVFRQARLELLLREGFTPATGVDLRSGRTIATDYGCMCGCYSGSDGEANLVLTWRSGQAYVHPADSNLDAALAQLHDLETAGFQGAVEANIKICEKLAAQDPNYALDPLRLYDRDSSHPMLDMTWAEWDAGRAARKTALLDLSAQAQETGEWEKVREHVKAEYGRSQLYDPAESGRRKAKSYLDERDIQRISATEALHLWTALSDTPPPAWLTGQAAAEPERGATASGGQVRYQAVAGATGSLRLPNSGTASARGTRATSGLGAEDPDIPSVDVE